MNLNAKVILFFVGMATALLLVLIAISLFALRSFSITSATEHIRTAGEIVRVHLTESMINGVIDKRERFLQRLVEIQGLKSARVVLLEQVVKQFGKGLAVESVADAVELAVLREGKTRFELLTIGDEAIFRGTIPNTATASGTPNCMQCHLVEEGAVSGGQHEHVG